MRRSHAPVVTGTGRFLSTSERAADHDCIGAASERLANVAAFAHPAVSDDRYVTRRSFEIAVARGRAIDRGSDLRDAQSEHAARCGIELTAAIPPSSLICFTRAAIKSGWTGS